MILLCELFNLGTEAGQGVIGGKLGGQKFNKRPRWGPPSGAHIRSAARQLLTSRPTKALEVSGRPVGRLEQVFVSFGWRRRIQMANSSRDPLEVEPLGGGLFLRPELGLALAALE